MPLSEVPLINARAVSVSDPSTANRREDRSYEMSDIRPSSVPPAPVSEISQDATISTFSEKRMSFSTVADPQVLSATCCSSSYVVIEEATAPWHNRAKRATRIRMRLRRPRRVALSTDGPAYWITLGPWGARTAREGERDGLRVRPRAHKSLQTCCSARGRRATIRAISGRDLRLMLRLRRPLRPGGTR